TENAADIFQTLTEHWNGTAWSVVPSPNVGAGHNYLNAVAAVAANDVWAVGNTLTDSSNDSTLIEHWDGSSWTVVPCPNPGATFNSLGSTTALAANNIWAAGSSSDDGNNSQTLIVHWDGAAWSAVSSPNVGAGRNYLSDMAAVNANDIWAVG